MADGENVTPFPKRSRKPPTPPPGGWPEWYQTLRRDERGRVIPDVANVLHALRGEVAIVEGCAFDDMLQATMVTSMWPVAPRARLVKPPPHELEEDDITRLQEWLQHMGLPRIGRDNVRDAVEAVAQEHRYHPIREWLNSLRWDGEYRLRDFLPLCLGTPADDYHRKIGGMFLIAMVARIFDPGCKCDYMLVLEGPQGEEKSKFCRALVGDAYFSEHLPRIDGDDIRVSMHLRGKWLIEVAELAAMLRADPEGTKHFISRQVEIYTPKYRRSEVKEPRQCLFIGTTNEDDYIRDVTGGRRFWPVAVGTIDIDRLEDMRDQLFAEAVVLYRDEINWWPEREWEKTIVVPIQDERQFEDALADRVREVIGGLKEVTLANLGSQLGFDLQRLDMVVQKRLAAILKREKWRKSKRESGGRIWRAPLRAD